jgi:hypothetical protein
VSREDMGAWRVARNRFVFFFFVFFYYYCFYCCFYCFWAFLSPTLADPLGTQSGTPGPLAIWSTGHLDPVQPLHSQVEA